MADINTEPKTVNVGLEKRKQLQKEAVNALMRFHYLKVNWGTGVGKSRVGVNAIDILENSGMHNILLLVAETAHKSNWKKEFIECLGEERGEALFNSITVECYASLDKYTDTKWDLICADEAHHLRSDKRVDILETLHADYFLCLSATLSCDGDAELLEWSLEKTFGPFVELNFGTQAAIDSKILAEPKIYVHILPLNDLRKEQTIVEAWGVSEKRLKLSCKYEELKKYTDKRTYPNAELTITCTPAQAYEHLTNRMNEWQHRYYEARRAARLGDNAETNITSFFRNKYIQYGGLRKQLLGKLKTTFSQNLLKSLGDKKYVCFCADVEQGITLGGENVIYADRKDGVNNLSVIDKFNADEIRSIFAVNMIQEGQNLAGIQAGVVIQLGGKERQFIQKFGRALRSKTPEQHIVIINNTRDIDWFKTAIQGINGKYIQYIPYGSLKARQDQSRSANRLA